MINILLFSILSLTLSFSYEKTQNDFLEGLDAGDVGTDGGVTEGGITDGGSTDAGIDFVSGCTDICADNFNPEATINDMTCSYSNCECFFSSNQIEQYYEIYECFLAVYVMQVDTCENLESVGVNCDLVQECGLCNNDSEVHHSVQNEVTVTVLSGGDPDDGGGD